jgi:DNA gyrase/topoisomerase IV subunit B
MKLSSYIDQSVKQAGNLLTEMIESMGGARAWKDTRQRQRENLSAADQLAGTNKSGQGEGQDDAADEWEIMEGDEAEGSRGDEYSLSDQDDSSMVRRSARSPHMFASLTSLLLLVHHCDDAQKS